MIFAGLSASAADAKRDIVTVRDADYFGFDLRTEQNLSLDQCKAACIGDKSCKAFTYNPKVKWCFLKSDFKTMNAFPGAIAGKIVETAGQQERDIGAAPRLTFGEGLVGRLVMFDARSMRFETLQYGWDPSNPLSGEHPTIHDLSMHG